MENIDISLIIAQLINFLILFFLFKRYIAVYLNKMIETRNATVEKVQNFETYYEKRIQELKEKELSIHEEAKKQAHDLLVQAENISQKKAQDILEKANQEVKMILEWWKRQMEKEKFQMIEDSRAYILWLAFKINQKLLWTKGISKEFIEEELKKM
jgi:F-type H+-transporting ATPase subunit b